MFHTQRILSISLNQRFYRQILTHFWVAVNSIVAQYSTSFANYPRLRITGQGVQICVCEKRENQIIRDILRGGQESAKSVTYYLNRPKRDLSLRPNAQI